MAGHIINFRKNTGQLVFAIFFLKCQEKNSVFEFDSKLKTLFLKPPPIISGAKQGNSLQALSASDANQVSESFQDHTVTGPELYPKI